MNHRHWSGSSLRVCCLLMRTMSLLFWPTKSPVGVMGAYSNRTFCPLGCYENPSVKVMQSLLTAMRLFCSLPLSVSSLLLRLSDLPNFRIFFHISSFPSKLNTTEPTVSHASVTEMVLEEVRIRLQRRLCGFLRQSFLLVCPFWPFRSSPIYCFSSYMDQVRSSQQRWKYESDSDNRIDIGFCFLTFRNLDCTFPLSNGWNFAWDIYQYAGWQNLGSVTVE